MRPTLTGIEQVLADAGGADAPRERVGQLRALLGRELQHGAAELAAGALGLRASGGRRGRRRRPTGWSPSLPVAPELRADPDAVDERAWLLAAATVGALVESPARRGCELTAGQLSTATSRCASPAPTADARARPAGLRGAGRDASTACKALALARARRAARRRRRPRPPIGAAHPLRGRAGASPGSAAARPTRRRSTEHEDAVLAMLEAAGAAGSRARTTTPIPSRRVARRILQRLDGMGKWGGYHTDFTHLARGFAGNDRALADEVGEALLRRRAAGREAERGTAPRLPQPAAGRRHPRAHRAGRRPAAT